MDKKWEEYRKAIAFLYILLVLALLPLWLLGALASRVRQLWNPGAPSSGGYFSAPDFFAAAFAVVSCLSYLFSSYKNTAFWGYPGWYMGLFTQLSLAGGYFLVSRWHEKGKVLPACVWLSSFAVCLTGVLNRLGQDPLHVYEDMAWWEWNRRNLLSTIGNINWFCSYLTVAAPLLLYGFWAASGFRRLAAGAGAFVGCAVLLLQGSSSGYAALAAMLAVLLYGSLKDMFLFRRFLETAMLVALFGFLMWLFQIGVLLPDDVSYWYTPLWGVVLLPLAGMWLLQAVCARNGRDFLKSGRVRKGAVFTGIVILAAAAALFAGCQLWDGLWEFFGSRGFLRFNEEWGSMRGQLWTIAWQGFREAGLGRQLYGVGPDCFALYFYENYPMDIVASGQWQDAVYANAHNEWLNMLINEGILGLAAYMGFFGTAFWRFGRRHEENPGLMAGMMAVAAYGVNQLFSFGQAVSTPQIFLVIGICENMCRTMDSDKEGKWENTKGRMEIKDGNGG